MNAIARAAAGAGLGLLLVSAVRAGDPRTGFRVAPDFFDRPLDEPARPLPPDTVVLRVNGLPVTQAEVFREVAARLAGGALPPGREAERLGQVHAQAVDALVARKLLIAEARRESLSVDRERIEEEIGRIRAAGASLDEFLERRGMTLDAFRAELGEQGLIQRLLDARVEAPPPASEEEALAFYRERPEQFEIPELAGFRHIFLPFEPGSPAAGKRRVRSEAARLVRRLNRGEDFGELAASRSRCPSREHGGRLGPVARGALDAALEEALFGRPLGEIGPAVETPGGMHIVQAERREPARRVSFEEALPEIRAFLDAQRRQEAVGRFVSGLRREAVIEDARIEPGVPGTEPGGDQTAREDEPGRSARGASRPASQ